MKSVFDCRVESNTRLNDKVFSLLVDASGCKGDIYAGQFFNLKCGRGTETYLRRPISVCDNDGQHIRFVVEIKGEGTGILSEIKSGEYINLLGPLGNGFTMPKKNANIAIIGGGLGVCPLFKLTKEIAKASEASINVIMGFRNKSYVILEEEYIGLKGVGVHITTDDGSYAHKGNVMSVYDELYTDSKPDVVYTCGPSVMMDAVIARAIRDDIRYQCSKEERMGCGIGACLVCACLKEDGHYAHVCKDGPVFGDLEENNNG